MRSFKALNEVKANMLGTSKISPMSPSCNLDGSTTDEAAPGRVEGDCIAVGRLIDLLWTLSIQYSMFEFKSQICFRYVEVLFASS